jgi:Sigma-70 region 2
VLFRLPVWFAGHISGREGEKYVHTIDYASRPNGVLLMLAREGNEDAFTELVRRNSQKIYRISRKVLKNHEDAEDTLQNVLVKVYQGLDGN